MYIEHKFYIGPLFCLILFLSCSKKSEKAKEEEEYMMSNYAEKTARPSPPAKAKVKVDDAFLGIYYSQPSVKGRVIWDELVPYDRIWRTGANEATVFKTTKSIVIEGDTIKPGKYSLFSIPSENSWTVMINKKYDLWGSYDYEEKYDVARFQVIPVLVPDFEEKMIFSIDSTGLVEFAWENLRFNFQINTLD